MNSYKCLSDNSHGIVLQLRKSPAKTLGFLWKNAITNLLLLYFTFEKRKQIIPLKCKTRGEISMQQHGI